MAGLFEDAAGTVSRRAAAVKGRWNRPADVALISTQPLERPMETYDAHKSTTEVRQGNRRMMNLRVLMFSVAAVVIVLALIWLVFAILP